MGFNASGQAEIPEGITNVVSIAAGDRHSLGLQRDGRVVAWGANEYGQANVPLHLTNVVSVAAGADQSMALTRDGTVAVWGRTAPLDRPLTNIVALAPTRAFKGINYALRKDGSIQAWNSREGKIYDLQWATNIAAIASGGGHLLALTGDGEVLGCGANSFGQAIGHVPEGSAGRAVEVAPVLLHGRSLTNVVAIAAGENFSLAIQNNGKVIAWGDNRFGQTALPQGLFDGKAVSVAAGETFAAAIVAR